MSVTMATDGPRYTAGVIPATAGRILIVDDDDSVRNALLRVMQHAGFACRDAASAAQALELLGSERFDVMITDVRMPGMSGVELVPRARILDDDLAILMLSGVNDVASATQAMKLGALDYLLKPASSDQLVSAITAALHRRSLDIERRRVEHVIREEVELRTADLEREKRSLRTLTVNVVQTLVNAMEAKDIYLRGHSIRVADLGAAIAEEPSSSRYATSVPPSATCTTTTRTSMAQVIRVDLPAWPSRLADACLLQRIRSTPCGRSGRIAAA